MPSTYYTAVGTDKYTIYIDSKSFGYYNGLKLSVRFQATNTKASVLELKFHDRTLSTKSIVDSKGSQMLSGSIKAGGIYNLVYDGSNFQIDITGDNSLIKWGSITGNISDQSDLQSYLNSKQDLLGFTAENVANKATDFTT